jgi:ribosome maturation factor RimP
MKEKDKIESIIKDIAKHNEGDVIDFTYNRKGKRCFVKVVLGGLNPDYNIDLQRITDITKEIKRNTEFEEIVPEDYRLEVTSPGADYAMKTEKDFTRNQDRKIRLRHNNLEVKTPVTGELVEVGKEGIYLQIDNDKIYFSYDEIEFGKVIF